MKLELRNTFRIKSVVRPTRAKHFSGLKVGDTIEISLTLKNTRTAPKGACYANKMTVRDNMGNEWTDAQNNLAIRLSHFDLEEV